MSLRPDHVEAARLGLGLGLLPASRPVLDANLIPGEQIGPRCREAGVMLERSNPAAEPGEGQMGNVGL